MAHININGNIIDSTAADHTYQDASSSEFIYVNSKKDMNFEQKKELFNLGVIIQEYVSEHTYLCHYKGTNLENIRALDYVRAVNVFEPAMKTDASIKNNTEQTEFKIEVEIHWDSPQTLQQVAEEISTRTGVPVSDMTVGSGRVELTVSKDKIEEIEKIDSVNHIEEFHPITQHNPYARGVLAQDWDYTAWGDWKNYAQFKGRGEIVCVCDGGTDLNHRVFKDKIFHSYTIWPDKDGNYVHKDVSGHGTHCAGSVVEGAASECKIVSMSMWDPQANGQRTWNQNIAWQFEAPYDNQGARVHSNSWGHSWDTGSGPGETPVRPRQQKQLGYDTNAGIIDQIVRKKTDYVIVFSAGNSGAENNYEGELACHNGAKNVITVGNCVSMRPNDNHKADVNCVSPDPRRMNSTSSSGPTLAEVGNKGRIKPDVVAPGTAILSALSRDKPYEKVKQDAEGNGAYWNKDYCFLSGTSMSTPHVASCCAVIREALRAKEWGYMSRPSASLVKALLINGTVDLKGHRFMYWKPEEKNVAAGKEEENFMKAAPNGIQGFGRVDLSNSLQNVIDGCIGKEMNGFGYVDGGDESNAVWSGWPRSLFINGENFWSKTDIPRMHKVICVTMVYPDAPGKGTQNTISFTVRCGDQIRKGNMGDDQQPWVFDEVNNVQKVVWENPPADTFSIELSLTNIAAPLDEKGNELRQPFAVAWMTHN